MGKACCAVAVTAQHMAKGDRQPDGGKEVGSILQLKVQVRFAGMARVTARADQLAGTHGCAGSNAHTALLQVGIEGVGVLVMLDDDVIPAQIRRGDIDSARAGAGIVANVVARSDDDAIGGGQHWLPEREVVGRLARIAAVGQTGVASSTITKSYAYRWLIRPHECEVC